MNRSRSVVFLLGALLLLPAFAAAQTTTLGRVSGTVLDESGGVVPGATITLTNAATGQVMSTTSGDGGAFLFAQVPVGKYTINVNLDGFKAAQFNDVTVAVGQEYSLTAKLAVGNVTDVVTVTAGSVLVSTTTPEVTSTVLQRQVLDIPLANRDITNLIKLQAGVPGVAVRANTTINGGRPTWTQVTLDGINIQDNFIRTNSLDFLPNRPTSDNVAEFSMTSSVQGADAAGGATSVRMVTPSGSNRITGSLYEFNRDAKFAANTFFNNQSGTPKPALSRHQFGGRVGGAIVRDKFFYFLNYEGFRQLSEQTTNLTIPANADFFTGVFRYVDLSGNVQSVNVLQLSGLSVDPTLRTSQFSAVPGPSNVNNFNAGNSTAARPLNTAGFRFNQTDYNNRDQYTGRLDYALTDIHRFEGVFSYFRETDDRTDIDNVSARPLVFTFSDPKRLALAWRWAASPRLSNELRGGFNLNTAFFNTKATFDDVLYGTALGISNPVVSFQAQGRYTDTYQLNNNTSYVLGSHQLQAGGSWQRNRVNPYNFAGQYPSVGFGFSSTAPPGVQLTTAQFPGGISSADLASANALAAYLSGTVSSVSQTFQVRDATSGYIPGIPSDETYLFDNIAAFVQDSWRWKPNFTIRAGLKWEYYSPLSEANNLGFLPQLGDRSFEQAILDPNTRVSFANGEFYKKDLNNFGPTIGFAWDVTNDGKTAVRGGYSLTYVNEDTVTVARAVGRSNAGLSTTVNLTNQYATVTGGVPLPATPAFLSERTLADQLSLSTSAVLWGIDPDIKSPYVHQVSVGIQRELPWSTAIEARYVGTFGRGLWRGTDQNQVTWNQEFLADFNRARTNGYLAQNAGLPFSPLFNPAVPGSQPLTVLPNFGGGLLTNATAISNIQQNQVGSLADLYITGLTTAALRADARAAFLQNPAIYSVNTITNGGFTDYNALQLELRRQFRGGFFGQVNYTLSDTYTNSDGTGQNRFEAFMDNNRPELNYGRSVFHVTHVMNANAIYELPFGRDRRWLNSGGLTEAIFGGWQVGTIVALQSGPPLTIFSGRGTFNRAGRSNCGTQLSCNTAVSTLSVSEIQKLMGIYKLPDGRIFWIDPKVIDPATGRAVGADNLTNAAGFPGQIFFNPVAGEVGNLPILAFDGPPVFRMDLALAKRTRIVGRFNLELKGEAFNVLNTPSFFRGDMDINSTTFGRITSVSVGSRVVQFSARLNF